MKFESIKRGIMVAAIAGVMAIASTAQAGSIYLNGHDVLLHSGQRGYADVILDYLRGAGTTSEISRADYDIGYLTNGGTNGGLSAVMAEFPSVTTASISSFADEAAFGTFLSGIDVMVLPWIFDVGAANSAILNSYSATIETFFNSGGDIWGNSSFTTATFYDFLPPSAAASGPSISGSSGFMATAEGMSIGITSAMINGFPTHNRFVSFDPDFTVFETRGEEVIAIGIRDARIIDGDVETGDDDGGDTTPPLAVPEPSTMFLLAGGLLGFAGLMRRKQQ